MSAGVSIDLSGRHGDFSLDVRLALPKSGVTVVFGRSGSGKTTLLRAVAGLTRLEGRVSTLNVVWQDTSQRVFLPTERRRIGFVFQDPALFPHLSVRDNLEFAKRRAGGTSAGARADDVVSGLALGDLLDRHPGSLSGGERQRVAIGRALFSSPKLMLLDEPLSALDVAARTEISALLAKLFQELSLPVIYVTHSVEEASRLADDVAWLDAGRVRALGTAEEIFGRLDFGVALNDDASGLIRASVARHDDAYSLTELSSDFGALFTHRLDARVGESLRLRIRARDVSIALERETASSIMNVFPAEIRQLTAVTPGEVLVQLACPTRPERTLLARVMKKSADDLHLSPGLEVFARVKGVTLR